VLYYGVSYKRIKETKRLNIAMEAALMKINYSSYLFIIPLHSISLCIIGTTLKFIAIVNGLYNVLRYILM